MTVTEKLIKLLDERGITRSELARGAGLPYTTVVALFEKGADNAKLPTIRKITKFLNITLDDLVDDKPVSSDIQTIAAHHDGEEWNKEELEAIEAFKALVRKQRQRG
jgi:DNA-binding XRE family transcriptional regulator